MDVRVRDTSFIQGQGGSSEGGWVNVSAVPDEFPEEDVELLDVRGGGGGHNYMVPDLG